MTKMDLKTTVPRHQIEWRLSSFLEPHGASKLPAITFTTTPYSYYYGGGSRGFSPGLVLTLATHGIWNGDEVNETW